MADLEIKPFVRPPPPPHSFRLTGSIDRPAFIKNILDSQLILNPPSSLEDLYCYNSTLSNLLNIHAHFSRQQPLAHLIHPSICGQVIYPLSSPHLRNWLAKPMLAYSEQY